MLKNYDFSIFNIKIYMEKNFNKNTVNNRWLGPVFEIINKYLIKMLEDDVY